jgi:hypothetical protein
MNLYQSKSYFFNLVFLIFKINIFDRLTQILTIIKFTLRVALFSDHDDDEHEYIIRKLQLTIAPHDN